MGSTGPESSLRVTTWDEYQHTESRKRRRPWISRSLREHVLNRDGRACIHCGRTEAEVAERRFNVPPFRKLHLDHIIPHSLGGPTVAWNLVASCPRCNMSRQHRFLDFDLLESTWRLEMSMLFDAAKAA